jgi:hypothetical protein
VAATSRGLSARVCGRLLRAAAGVARRWGLAPRRAAPAACASDGGPGALQVAAPARWLGLIGGMLAAASTDAVELQEDRADVMYHEYTGGGVTATGPAVLIRKSLFDRVSLTGTYYVDMVSNASIDVVTTASPYSENRQEYGLGLDYVYRDALVTLSGTHSREPDYTADSVSADVSQEVFGGMTTVSMGYTRGWDKVGKHNTPTFSATADHWQYRLGVTQILTPRWLASLTLEAIADQGSPYRAVRVFGAFIPERVPATRSSRAVTLRVAGDIGSRGAVRAQYRYFWDTWDIRAHTAELGYGRYLGQRWLLDASFRYYKQDRALFYSDNFGANLQYMSRNRQLGTFDSLGPGIKASYTVYSVPSRYEVKLNGAYQWLDFKYSDFTDLRTGKPYSFNASVLEFFVSATY